MMFAQFIARVFFIGFFAGLSWPHVKDKPKKHYTLTATRRTA